MVAAEKSTTKVARKPRNEVRPDKRHYGKPVAGAAFTKTLFLQHEKTKSPPGLSGRGAAVATRRSAGGRGTR